MNEISTENFMAMFQKVDGCTDVDVTLEKLVEN